MYLNKDYLLHICCLTIWGSQLDCFFDGIVNDRNREDWGALPYGHRCRLDILL